MKYPSSALDLARMTKRAELETMVMNFGFSFLAVELADLALLEQLAAKAGWYTELSKVIRSLRDRSTLILLGRETICGLLFLQIDINLDEQKIINFLRSKYNCLSPT